MLNNTTGKASQGTSFSRLSSIWEVSCTGRSKPGLLKPQAALESTLEYLEISRVCAPRMSLDARGRRPAALFQHELRAYSCLGICSLELQRHDGTASAAGTASPSLAY